MNKKIIVITLLLLTIAISFLFPKPKYQGEEILKKINIPWRMSGWQSRNIAYQLKTGDDRYNFIGDIFARMYANRYGEKLLFLVLDAGNFHNPKVCYGGSGFGIEDLNSTKIETKFSTIEAQTLFAKKEKSGTLIIYWLCINKKLASWSEQKTIELWNTLLNKKKTGLMVRVEVPTDKDHLNESIRLAQEFFVSIANSINKEDAEFIFGTK